MTIFLASICIYPIKSTAGVPLNAADVGLQGLAGDRRWMVVDHHGVFISAREYPRLVLLSAHPIAGGGLVITAPDRPPIEVKASDNPKVEVTMRGDQMLAAEAGAPARQWLSDWLGIECQLVRVTENSRCQNDSDLGPTIAPHSFVGGHPILLISEASLEDLDSRAPIAISMLRFRPNLTIRGCPPFTEDSFTRVRIGPVEFENVEPSVRCVLTTVDPSTGERDARQEPLRTLSTYRRNLAGQLEFGIYLVPRSLGAVRVGDRLDPLT